MKLMIFSLASVILWSCQSDRNTQEGSESGNLSKVEIIPIGPEALQQLITNREGRILLVNVWATWCIPCREEFPDLVRLAREYNNKDVDIIGISVDYPDEIESKIVPFIKQQNVNFPIYVQTFDKQENFINYFHEDWSGALPATFIFDSSGEQQDFLLGKHSYEEFKQALEDL